MPKAFTLLYGQKLKGHLVYSVHEALAVTGSAPLSVC
jgi:hypothetical protein